MFYNYLIKNYSLENVYEDVKAIGFKFAVRIADYWGCLLSLHNGYYIECDRVKYPRNLQRFEIDHKEPRNFEEIKKCIWEHWNYDDDGYIEYISWRASV